MAKVLRRSDIQRIVDEAQLIGLVESAFAELADGLAVQPHRGQLHDDDDNGLVLIMPGLLRRTGSMGVKVVTVYPDNPRKFDMPNIMASTLLMDSRTGEPLCFMDATYLTAMRTGAVCAVATKHLAAADASSLGIIGTGAQAEAIASYVCAVRPIRSIRAFSDDTADRKEAFRRRVSEKTGLAVSIVQGAEEAVRGAEVLVTATSSKRPVISSGWISDGAHINAIGNHDPNAQELDSETVARSVVVCDDVEACLAESGDCGIPLAAGMVPRGHFKYSLGDVVKGRNPERNPCSVTLFKSIGLAIQDVAAGYYAYKRAVELGVGIDIDLRG